MSSYTFTFCPVESFPEEETFQVPYQVALDGTEENPATNFLLSARNFLTNFDRWEIHHDIRVAAFGRVYGKTFHYYVAPHKFPMYLSRDYRLLVIQQKREMAHNFVDVLNKNLDGFKIGRYSFDIKAMLEYLPSITSVWVGGLGEQYVKTAGYFGQNVDRSDELQAKLQVGQITALRVQYPLGSDREEISAGINSKGSITLFTRFRLDEHALQTVIDIFEKYVLPTSPQKEFSQNSKRGSSKRAFEELPPTPTGQLQFPD